MFSCSKAKKAFGVSANARTQQQVSSEIQMQWWRYGIFTDGVRKLRAPILFTFFVKRMGNRETHRIGIVRTL
jgi:hypothetical protein